MKIQEKLINFLKENGVADVGFSAVPDGPFGNKTYAVSIVVKLSDAVIDEITDEPTHTYFHHYRTVNAFIDRVILQAGFMLEAEGYRYIPVGASQSINKDGWNYSGRYSHKKAACLAGLGSVGRNSLFLHSEYGSFVRLGTIFTDCAFDVSDVEVKNICNGCDLCVEACPAIAIKGIDWYPGIPREEVFDPEACSTFMKTKFQKIGRGSVCGICMSVCPMNKR